MEVGLFGNFGLASGWVINRPTDQLGLFRNLTVHPALLGRALQHLLQHLHPVQPFGEGCDIPLAPTGPPLSYRNAGTPA